MTLVILLLIAVGGAGVWYVWNGMQPIEPAGPAVTFTIERGMGSAEIADLLEHKGIIRNSLFFKGYLKLTQEGSSFKAGTYTASPGDSYDELIARLNAGDVVKEETVVFTIPEGYTAKQIADKLAEAWGLEASVFLEIINSGVGLNEIDGLEIPQDKDIRHRLEGYMFPETYELVKDSTPEEVIDALLRQFHQKLDTIPNWQQKLKDRGLSLHEDRKSTRLNSSHWE